jgi:hypothetical protein
VTSRGTGAVAVQLPLARARWSPVKETASETFDVAQAPLGLVPAGTNRWATIHVVPMVLRWLCSSRLAMTASTNSSKQPGDALTPSDVPQG